MLNQPFKPVNDMKNYCLIKKQQGLVLFIALIALVAMSLAAAALVRSVDSGVLVAGNLAFKQSAVMSAETGISDAYRYINDNLASLESSTVGYFALFDDNLDLKDNSTWGAANSFLVANDAITGNETRYILQRMCWADGPSDPAAIGAVPNNCLQGVGSQAPNSQSAQTYTNQAPASGSSQSVVYRVTVRVTGPKNTKSYLQAFVY